MPKIRAKRSAIWQYFSEHSECDNNTLVKCNACNVALPFCRNTTNLWSHIRIHHKSILDSISVNQFSGERSLQAGNQCSWSSIAADPNEPTMELMQIPSTSHSTMQQYAIDSERFVEITKALLLMIAEDVYPFSIVNDRGFVNFVRTLDEKYQLPDKNSLATKYLPELYASKCKEIMDRLSDTEYVHLTIDSWTDVNRKMSFFAITAHSYIRGALQHNTLRVSYIPTQCSSKNLHEMIDSTADAWNIRYKIKTVVCDNVSSVNAPWRRISCFEHTLNMVVYNAIRENEIIANLLRKCKDIVHVFRTNSAVAEALKNERVKRNCPKGLVLKKDVVGRWKSVYLMLCNMMDSKSSLSLIHGNLLENNMAYITQKEWDIISGIIQVLKPFYEAVGEISADRHVAISKIIPIVHCIEAALANQENLIGDVILLRANLMNKLGMCFEDIEVHPIYSIATFLDPRYKNIAFRSNECVVLVKNLLTSQLKLQGDSSNDVYECANKVQQGRNEINDVNDTLWAEFDKRVQEAVVHTEYFSYSLKDELERYLLLKPINRKSNPISWWNAEGKTLFPKLMKLALEYLCIPATCVSNEQLFSKIAHILSQRRTRIQSKYINMLSILHLNKNK